MPGIVNLLDLYLFIILLYTLYKLFLTSQKTKGGIVGQGMFFFLLGFALIFTLTIKSILETSFGFYFKDIFGENLSMAMTRLAEAVAYLTFAIGASKLEKIG